MRKKETTSSEEKILDAIVLLNAIYVTGSEKTAHFAQHFKTELLVFNDRVDLKQ